MFFSMTHIKHKNIQLNLHTFLLYPCYILLIALGLKETEQKIEPTFICDTNQDCNSTPCWTEPWTSSWTCCWSTARSSLYTAVSDSERRATFDQLHRPATDTSHRTETIPTHVGTINQSGTSMVLILMVTHYMLRTHDGK